MSDKMLDEFESWFYASKYAQVTPPTESSKQAAWDGWQASRESLVIELPLSSDTHDQFWKDDVIEAIEAAGLKVKP